MQKPAVVLGNIGVPITSANERSAEFVVIEASSYQAANFTGECEVGVLTTLYPEHLDWHRAESAYYRDKANLLEHAQKKIVGAQAWSVLRDIGYPVSDAKVFGDASGLHVDADGRVYSGKALIGPIENAFLAKEHNRTNVSAVLAVVENLGFDLRTALKAMTTYQGLPHRQQELGVQNDVLFVNDSMSTIPQAAIAALKAYAGRPRTLIAGGFDRGVDYAVLVAFVLKDRVETVVCIGDTGPKLQGALQQAGMKTAYLAASMQEAVALAKEHTPPGGVILLSPGASSFGMFRDYVDRAQAFAKAIGLSMV